jgi:putative thioredoxin
VGNTMNAAVNVVEVNAENFQTEVVEKSAHIPVMLEFYADAAEPSQQLAPVLRQLADEYQGKFLLARIDVQANQQIVQQLAVKALPTIKIIFQGKMVQELEGPQDAATLRNLLDQITMSPLEQVRGQINQLVEMGQRGQAIELLQQVIAQEPKNFVLHAELCDLLIMENRTDEAKQILASLPDDTEGVERPKNRIQFIELAENLAPLAELQKQVDDDSSDLQGRLDLAYRFIVDDQIEAALDQLLDILKVDRDWQEQKARTTMIQVFELLGKGNELATAYRRKMFTFLH